MGAGPFFYGKKSPTPERILSYAEGCPASAGLWIKKKQVVRTAPVLPVRGGGPCASTVVGASAAADTLQEPWTTVGRVVEIWKGKIGDPEAPVSVFPRYSVLSGPHAPTTGQARSPAPAGRTWPPAMLVLFAGIRRYPGSREGRPRRSRRDNIDSGRLTGGARGRDHLASWSVAAAFDRQGKAIGCEPPARDERVCPPSGRVRCRSVRV